MFRTEAVEVELIVFAVQRGKKRNSLDMVPVVVGDENMRLGIALAGFWSGPTAAENAQPGAAIENELRAVGGDELKAGRVAAVAPGGRIDGRSRATDSPKAEPGHRVRG